MSWIYAAILAVVVVAAVLLRPKTPKQKPLALEDFTIPTAEEGRSIPIIFGKVTTQGSNVCWFGDLGYDKVRTKTGK